MKSGTYNFGTFIAGDTVTGRDFTITRTSAGTTSPEDLTGANASMVFFGASGAVALKFTDGDGLTITNNVIALDSFRAPNVAGRYEYNLEIGFPTGESFTYLHGSLKAESGA